MKECIIQSFFASNFCSKEVPVFFVSECHAPFSSMDVCMANQKNPFISNKVHKQIHFAKEGKARGAPKLRVEANGDAVACVRQNASGICASACQRGGRRGANTCVLQPHNMLL